MYELGKRSMERLTGVHGALQAVGHEAISNTGQDFSVIEGGRTVERQIEMIESFLSEIPRDKPETGKHVQGRAVDIIPYSTDWQGLPWDDIPRDAWCAMGHAMRVAGLRLGVPIRWLALESYGGHSKRFHDAAHFEMF